MIYNKSGSKDEFFIYRDAICEEGGDIMATKVGQKYECRECGLIIKVVEEGSRNAVLLRRIYEGRKTENFSRLYAKPLAETSKEELCSNNSF